VAPTGDRHGASSSVVALAGLANPDRAAEGCSLQAMGAGEKPHDRPRCHNGAQAVWAWRPAGRDGAHRRRARGFVLSALADPGAALIGNASLNPSHVTFAAALDARQRLARKTVERAGDAGVAVPASAAALAPATRRRSGPRPSQTPGGSGGPQSGRPRPTSHAAPPPKRPSRLRRPARRNGGSGLPLDGFFSLNNAMSTLHALYARRQQATIVACGAHALPRPLALRRAGLTSWKAGLRVSPGRLPPSKVLPPYDFLLAVARGLAIPYAPDDLLRRAARLGQPLWQPPAPSGFPDGDIVWASPSALNERLRIAEAAARQVDATADPRQR
jgi:hypothetical protein